MASVTRGRGARGRRPHEAGRAPLAAQNRCARAREASFSEECPSTSQRTINPCRGRVTGGGSEEDARKQIPSAGGEPRVRAVIAGPRGGRKWEGHEAGRGRAHRRLAGAKLAATAGTGSGRAPGRSETSGAGPAGVCSPGERPQ